MSYLKSVFDRYRRESLSESELSLYARHLLLPGIGLEGQLKLKCSRVLVVGAGGLGCPVLQALAGAGVGQLSVIDPDAVALSNGARQWLHYPADAGRNKAESAAEKLRAQNPFIRILPRSEAFSDRNGPALVGEHDLVIDATDNLPARLLIDKVCADFDRPWVYAGLYRDAFQIAVFWKRCGALFKDLFPEESQGPDCSLAGILGATSSLAGNWQAREAIKLITGSGPVLPGHLVTVNATTNEASTLVTPGAVAPERLGTTARGTRAIAWKKEQLRQAFSIHKPVFLVDLGTNERTSSGILRNAEKISADEILENPALLPDDCTVCLACENGIASRLLAESLNATGRKVPVVYLEKDAAQPH